MNRKQQHEVDCLVVGAGIAGLVAAYWIAESGLSVTILEARSRAGGRLLSMAGPLGISIELGGELIGSFHNALLSLCRRLSIGVESLGTVSDVSELIPDRISLGDDVLSDQRVRAIRIELDSLIGDLVSLSRAVNWSRPWASHSPYISEWRQTSVDQWLYDHGISSDLRAIFSDMAPGTHSVLALMALIAAGGGERFFLESECFVVRPSLSLLVQRLAETLGDRIQYDTAVTSIERGSVVTISCRRAREHHNLTARTAVVAVPAACLPKIEGVSSIRHVSMSKNQKLTIFMKPSRTTEAKQGYRMITDGWCRIIDAKHQTVGDETIARIDSFLRPVGHHRLPSTRQLVKKVLADCGMSATEVTNVYRHDWSRSPWSRGSYAVFGPSSLTDDHESLIAGVGTVQYAGDYVIPGFAGYMEGAVRSAEMAADRVKMVVGATTASRHSKYQFA